MTNVKKWFMAKIFNKNEESEFSKVLKMYFKAENCELRGDVIVNKENDEAIGNLICATYTGKDIIVQAKLIVGREEGKDLYEEYTVVVSKNQIEQHIKRKRK